MPATAAARVELTGVRGTPKGVPYEPFTFGLASGADDSDIRRLLRAHAMPGAIAVSLQREPHSSLAASIEGEMHETLIARSRATGELCGMAARSVRTVYVNGKAVRLGSLGQLRVASGRHALRTLIDEGFAFCRMLHQQDCAPAYLVSLVADNSAARRLLVDRRSPTAPRLVSIGGLDTFVIPARRGSPASPEPVQIVRGSQAHVSELVDCLQRNLRRYQLAPCWTAAELQSELATRGLSIDDFAIALADGRVVGCLALWDQRAFKQVVVRSYGPALRRTRPLINAAARLMGFPRLPPVGERLEFAYLSHVAVDADRPHVLMSLVGAQVEEARRRGLEYVVTGFPDRHPFHTVVRDKWAWRTYRSALYLAHWPDGSRFIQSLDGRVAQPEVAVL
jgi:hypothetical protein